MLVITLIFLMILMVISVKDSYKYKKTDISTIAKVISKRKESNSSKKSKDNKEILENEYYIVFEDANGRQQEFSVGKEEFKRLNKGAKGKLSFKGTEFIKFEKGV
ncbi:DUF2500 family protein [Clostridium thermobutyricum]|uniref:DUF2500 domain-containing protein n=1 Tax=Clostridium thermobutyricum DSM 4928 TaxID=1121339 RepID=A0A1V4SRX1_9CLOT|nr:DUF2500 family protein [Clostridium thermobutyricum]OPX46602.1 hypothetical protein CLTHE_28230 [Clostridium thermobutyricum DSM 4928]